MSDTKYIVGIDLGTTHCVVAYVERPTEDDSKPEIKLFEIPQVTGPGEIKGAQLLPSFIFMPGRHDVSEGSLALPWNKKVDLAVGDFARKRGAELPDRLVSSAKSWLCNEGVDRTRDILPWDSPKDARHISPLTATQHILQHIRAAWNHTMAAGDKNAKLENQDIYLTVPASFDAVARELTVKAAQSAGLQNLTLLEEPQAAFYAWLQVNAEAWRDLVNVGESILVVDIGGGTTDFSLIQVEEEDGQLTLQRVAVGNHILLGGDNMDLALTYGLRSKLAQKNIKIDAWQFRGLSHSCRNAKEKLMQQGDLESEPVVILGKGSSLIGGTIRTELTRSELETILLDGFFPVGDADDHPQEKQRVGMQEMGLPYEADPAITRHLAAFVSRETSGDGHDSPPFPGAVLFNGGVMKADLLRGRIVSALNQWRGQEVRLLESVGLDLAVGQGAAYYGLATCGRGIRIRAGASRSYYIGVETSMPAVPGVPAPMKALCLVPFGMEEGASAEAREKEFGLIVGEPASFHLLASSNRKSDAAGTIVEDWTGEIAEVATMEVELPANGAGAGSQLVPVWLQSKFTEIGTLEIWCVARDDPAKKWKLEFNLREHTD